jgi:capsular exopolysaccharide synthesis family protein
LDDELRDGAADSAPSPPAAGSILRIVWQRRWLVLLGAVIGPVLALLHYSQRPSVYRSGAQVLVVKKRSEALPVSNGGDPRLAVYEDYVSTHLILIRSPLVVERAVQKRNLGALKSFQGADPAGAILNGLSANREQPKDGSVAPNNVIILSFAGPDAADVQAVLNAVIDSYREFLDETYQSVSNNTLELIAQASGSLKKDLEEKERKYREFRKNSPLMVKGEGGSNVHGSRILELLKKETGLLEKAAEIRERLAAIDKARRDGLGPDVILALASRPLDKAAPPPQNEQALEAALFPLLLKEQDLLQYCGKDHPDLVRLRKQIAMTRELYQRIDTIAKKNDPTGPAGTPNALESQVQALRQEQILVETAHTGLVALLKDEEAKARGLELYEIQDEGFRTDISRTTRVLDQTLKRLEEISLVRDGGFDARVIAPPGLGLKVSPVLTQSLMLGALLGLMLGVGAAYLADLCDKSFRTPEEIRRRLRLPIVGHIPYGLEGRAPVRVAGPGGDPVELDAGLCACHRPSSAGAEAYRGVRTALYFSTQGERHKVIQVTSPNMGDGKTTVAANLAVSIAQSGRRVLLVDADLRRPRVHRVFGLSVRRGLAEVIAGTDDAGGAVRPTAIPGLSVLPCGRRPPNPAELLTSPRFAEVLDDLREAYDYVLVDSPPLLAVSDPCVIAPRVDGLLLVLRVSKNGRPAAERARDILNGLRVESLGVVINGVGRLGAASGYGYEYYHYEDRYTSDYAPTENEPDAEPDGGPAIGHPPVRGGLPLPAPDRPRGEPPIRNGQVTGHTDA